MRYVEFFYVEEFAAGSASEANWLPPRASLLRRGVPGGTRVLAYRATPPAPDPRRGLPRVWGFSGSSRSGVIIPAEVQVVSLTACRSSEMLESPITASKLTRSSAHDALFHPIFRPPSEARLLVVAPEGVDPSSLQFRFLYEQISKSIGANVVG